MNFNTSEENCREIIQNNDIFTHIQNRLPNSFNKIPIIVEYLYLLIRKTRNINVTISSYGMKHIFEDVLGRKVENYITNGEFILSALIVGFRMKKNHNSPNPIFNMNKNDIDRLEDIRREIIQNR
jgi:hypothetical protein